MPFHNGTADARRSWVLARGSSWDRYGGPASTDGALGQSVATVRRRANAERKGTLEAVLSARNRELLGLVPAALLVIAGFAAIFIQAETTAGPRRTPNHASSVSLTYGGVFLALCLAGHLVIRLALPHADPYLFPLAAVLASVGIVMIYRINPTLARQQAQWMVVGLVLFAATIVALRRAAWAMLENYRYTIAAVGIGMTVLPRLPGIGGQVNGAYLAIHVGGVSFQPSELGKIAIVIFLASYLRDNRQMLVDRRAARARRDDPADEAVRADAAGVGRGDGDAAGDARDRHVADVLRRVPRAALRRDRARLVPAHRPRAVRRRRVLRRRARRPRPRPRARLGAPVRPGALQPPGAAATSSRRRCSRRPTAACSGSGFDQSLLRRHIRVSRSCRSRKATRSTP